MTDIVFFIHCEVKWQQNLKFVEVQEAHQQFHCWKRSHLFICDCRCCCNCFRTVKKRNEHQKRCCQHTEIFHGRFCMCEELLDNSATSLLPEEYKEFLRLVRVNADGSCLYSLHKLSEEYEK